MRVLLALDKFKGTSTAWQACESVRSGMAAMMRGTEFSLCPIADGGEGTVEALSIRLRGRRLQATVRGPLGAPVLAGYLLDQDPAHRPVTAYLEMASASGLMRLADHERDPLRATTYGTGELMRAALDQGAQRIVLGLGGSATNDGGTGAARAFGFRFLDDGGEEIFFPCDLIRLTKIEVPSSPPENDFLLLADVDNPLLGPNGATAIYGPQKGVTPALLPTLEAGLHRLADVAARDLGRDPRDVPGAGAAGGCAYGLMTFLGARLVPGFDYVSRCLGLEEAVRQADWVVTGEGRMDRQTLSGKGPAGVAALAKKHGKPVAAVCGCVENEVREELHLAFKPLLALTDQTSPEEAMQRPRDCLEEAGRRLATELANPGRDRGPTG